MATAAETITKPTPPLHEHTTLLQWFGQFVKEELAPYPGRTQIVARMVIAATLVMIICETLRVPFAWQAAIYALLVSRESPRATLQSAATLFFVTSFSAAYFLVSAHFVISMPALHFAWVIGTMFLGFYALSIFANYVAAVAFVNIIAAEVPLWDNHVPAEFNVERTIWLWFAVLIGAGITAGVELAFSRTEPRQQIVAGIAERLHAVQSLLARRAENHPLDQATEANVTRLGMVGTSMLRRILARSAYSPQYAEEMGAVVALTGRLIDIAAGLKLAALQVSGDGRTRIRRLVENIAAIRLALLAGAAPELKQPFIQANAPREAPLLTEMEKTVALIPQAFGGSQSVSGYAAQQNSGDPLRTFFVRDAFSNVEHVKFAVKGCLTAGLCYVIYNAIDWPGISTAVTTCFLTALSTTGSSRQKQVLRISGAVAGGFLLGMGSQIFVLPYVDSIAGFTILFIFVTALASWFVTSSPRLSYFGIQMALAFYLVNLEEFAIRTSLAVARDRVVGILLGLVMMWLVFDRIWGTTAVVQMKKTFIAALRLLAEFAREPISRDYNVAAARGYSLREAINNNFDGVRASADGVLFEFGTSRQQDLAWRTKFRRWQPQLRLLFITEIALWKYRARLPGFELPQSVVVAQRAFDDELARTLNALADRIDGRRSAVKAAEDWLEPLEHAVKVYDTAETQQETADRFKAFLSLHRRIESLATSLQREI